MALNLEDSVQAISERQLAMERQLSELAGALKALEIRVAELSQSLSLRTPAASGVKVVAAAAKGLSQQPAVLREEEKVTPEVLVTIAAAVSTFLGKKINIRSAKSLQSPYEVINPWSQQGRVFVQASHNLRSRR